MDRQHEISCQYVEPDESMRYPGIIFSHQHGEVATYLDTDHNILVVDDIEVASAERGNGIGTAMLRAVYNLASGSGVSEVRAVIVSRECLEAMRTVFGVDNVVVRREGDFRPPDDILPKDFKGTSASLRYMHTARG